MKLYGVVIMDIVGSRNIFNRLQFQNTLIDYINMMNKKLNKILAAPISVTLGDEWQAVTDFPSECYEIIFEFQQNLWQAGVDIYAGIGIGELDTKVYRDIRRMDGPCFHSARNAIEVAKTGSRLRNKLIHSKHNKVYFQAQPESILNIMEMITKERINLIRDNSKLQVAGVPLVLDEVASSNTDGHGILNLGELINVLIENNEILKAKMTSKQKKIYTDYIKFGTYRNMIKEYGNQTSESVGGISQKLNSAEFFTIQRNQKIIKKLFDYYCALRGLV